MRKYIVLRFFKDSPPEIINDKHYGEMKLECPSHIYTDDMQGYYYEQTKARGCACKWCKK